MPGPVSVIHIELDTSMTTNNTDPNPGIKYMDNTESTSNITLMIYARIFGGSKPFKLSKSV